jgi:hypothetical protein
MTTTFKLKNRRFYEKTSRSFDRSHFFDRIKIESEFDLIKIWSSLIVNVKRIFIKNVAKKTRDIEKLKSKSDDCLIKILSSLIVNAKRIFINSIRSFDQVVFSKKSIEDKKKNLFSKEKFFFYLNQQKFQLFELKSKVWSMMNCECFSQSWNSFKKASSNCLKRMI